MEFNPVLYRSYRGHVCESAHRGAVCLLDASGSIQFSLGDPHQVTYPRSALKFFQQLPLLESGAADALGLSEEELAITCGSHNGEERHVAVVRQILEKAGLDETYLQCGPQYPSRYRDRLPFYKNDWEPQPIYNNCSGKHAGFLALCHYWGYDVADYLAYDHPIQVAVKKAVAEMHDCGVDQLEGARDGCSAPIYPLSLYRQALGYQQLGLLQNQNSSRGKACAKLLASVETYPFMIAGNKRYCTQLLQHANERVIGKTGAEGIFGLTLPQRGIGMAIKIENGQMGPQYAVAQQLLQLLEVKGIEPLNEWKERPLTNLNNWHVGSKGIASEAFESFRSELKALAHNTL